MESIVQTAVQKMNNELYTAAVIAFRRNMMNYLISAYSVNPYKGSEDSIGWNWVLQYEKNYKGGDRIILLTKKFNEKDTRKGLKELIYNMLNWLL